MVLHTSTSCSG